MSNIMKRLLTSLCVMSIAVAAMAQIRMTDEQVVGYVEQSIALGKDRATMLKELSLRGITRSQAERATTLFEELNTETGDKKPKVIDQPDRGHKVNDGQKDQKQEQAQEVPFVYSDTSKVYGRNIFRNRNLDFAPSENLATPRNYRLGPGDEVIIDIFGRNQATIREFISPEGSINVDILGPLYLNGMTIDEANKFLKKRLAQIYGGLNSRADTDMRLSLGQIRTIQVNVLGDVAAPGTYQLSAFATAFHALHKAGGVIDPGTLRYIKVIRGDKVAGVIDVYEFLKKGSVASDIQLDEGDVILVSPYSSMVKLEGAVKRPMYFEMKAGETISDLLEYAGGFAGGANTSTVTVFRQNGKNFEVCTVDAAEFDKFKLVNSDKVEVGELQSRYTNRVAIHGAVYFPGTFELESVRTVKGLLEKAGGVLPEAYTDRVVVHREYPDKTYEVMSVNLTEILAGRQADFVLQNNDELFVSNSEELSVRATFSISGMVNSPGTYPFSENTTVEDLIIIAGGLREGASTARVDVTRRKKDANGLVATSDIGELYTFPIEGLSARGDSSFVLEPYDEVVVRQSPSYSVQRHFTVNGEVNFPGVYPMTSREERISDLIKKAGGLTDFSYPKGARLIRTLNEEEGRVSKDMVEIITDETEAPQKDLAKSASSSFTVSVDLQKALENPGGDADVVLREGDVLEIPAKSNVVRINGAVKFQTAVNYDASMRAGDYISAAGGYKRNADRCNAYVVYMGGRAKRLHAWTKVEPGSEIFVPEKVNENKEFNYAALTAITTSAASMTALVVTLVNLLKK